ncbi:MAG: ATP-binding domain-containing protein [Planctomycetaceae bacterium]|jgi:superfamily I DNA and RNA helicase|nr:ATP-binding domain-containing protein [Planctomycetaceae bacterium]
MSLETIRGSIKNNEAVSKLLESIDSGISGTIYFGYPILASIDTNQAIDALLLSKEYGLIVFSFESSCCVTDIITRQDEIAFALEAYLMKSDLLRQGRKLAIKPVVISFFPSDDDVPQYKSEEEYFFAGPETILNLIKKVCQSISTEYFTKLSAVIQRVQNLKPNKKRNNIKKEKSKGSILKKLEKEIANLDQWQKWAAIETCEGPQRIRGLAGSGKTVVLALKAAYLHAQHPDWDIVVTFNTKSLRQQFQDLIERFTYEQSGEKPDWNKVHIMHAWGSYSEPGIYSTIAQSLDVVPMDLTTAKNRYGMDAAFSGICNELIAVIYYGNKNELFDVVLIDEAQDLPISFMQLVYHTTKHPKRVVWAYDELQNLYNTSMPPVEEMFGKNKDGNPLVSLRNSKDSARQDIALPVCYRNTPWALVVAHALGFGIYREQGLVQFFDTPAFWEEVGYTVLSGALHFSHSVTLQRNPTSYPGYFKDESPISPEDAIRIFSFNSEREQYESVAEQILQNIEKDELDPDDILVIFPNARTTKSEFALFRESLLQRGLNSHLAGVTTDTDIFFKQGSITSSGINRAKGNEASMVYVMNAGWCATGIEMIRLRNILFTAITRSKAWVRICGTGMGIKILKKEYDFVVKNNYSLCFTVPSEEELQWIRRINRDRTPDEQKEIKQASEDIKKLNDLLRKGVLNPETMPELQELIHFINLANK